MGSDFLKSIPLRQTQPRRSRFFSDLIDHKFVRFYGGALSYFIPDKIQFCLVCF
jgi:hypothetical protein